MENFPAANSPYIPRPNEYERLVSYLLDPRFFLPAAITTSLRGAHGFGKTRLARAVCEDARVQAAFGEGIFWVTLGEDVSPLNQLARIEHLIYAISGERVALTDLRGAEAHLHAVLHPRRSLLVLDDADNVETMRPFLQAGPGGACLIVSHQDQNLPEGARRVFVDILMPEESAALLLNGLESASPPGPGDINRLASSGEGSQIGPPSPFNGEGRGIEAVHEPPTQPVSPPRPRAEEPQPTAGGRGSSILASVERRARTAPLGGQSPAAPDASRAGQAPAAGEAASPALLKVKAAIVTRLTAAMTDRLNEWPLLITLANGYLRAAQHAGESLEGALNTLQEALARQGVEHGWRIDDPAARQSALQSVLAVCLEPLSAAQRAQYMDLAVFPAAEEIPLSAAAVLWSGGLSSPTAPGAAAPTATAPTATAPNVTAPGATAPSVTAPNVTTPGATAPTVTAPTDAAPDLPAARALCEVLARRALIEYDPLREHLCLSTSLQNCARENQGPEAQTALHARLLAAYRARSPRGWASGPDDGYFFQHLAGHLAAAGLRAELQDLLFDFAWLIAFLNCADCPGGRRGDLYALLADFDLGLATALDRQSAQLRLVQDALRMAGPALTRDPRQLAPQLIGRLLPFQEPQIVGLVQKAVGWRNGPDMQPWLRPLVGCFTPPGGDEVRVITGHTDWVTGIALLPDGQRAVSCSLDGTLRIWDLTDGKALRVIAAHPGRIATGVPLPGDLLETEPAAPVSSPYHNDVAVPQSFTLPGAPDKVIVLGPGVPDAELPTVYPSAYPLPPAVEPTQPQANPTRAGGVCAMRVTPDGQRAVTAGWEGALRVWNLTTGQLERTIPAHSEAISALVITPNGQRIISGGDDSRVRVWDLESGTRVFELTGHTDLVRSLAITPDGRTLLSASWDRTLRLWDLETGSLLHVLTGHTGWVTAATFTPDGTSAVSGSWDRTVRIWDLYTGEAMRVLSGFHAPVFSLAVSPDARLLLMGGGNGGLELWDLPTGQPLRVLTGHRGGINALSLTASGSFVISGSDDRSLRIWDLFAAQSGQRVPGHSAPVPTLTNTAGGRGVLSASWDGSLKLWDPAAGREVRSLPGHPGGVTAICLSTDGRVALTGGRDQRLRLWNLANGAEIRNLAAHEHTITAVALNADASLAVSGDDGGIIKVWDMVRGTCVAEFHAEGAIWACTLSADGKNVTASASGGQMIFLHVEA